MSMLTPNQRQFLVALAAHRGNVSRAAKSCGQSRSNHDRWLKSSSDYLAAVESPASLQAPVETPVAAAPTENLISSVSYRLYAIWNGMKTRCFNPNVASYGTYGGRGITICPEWMTFEGFALWAIEAGYRVGLSIDRVNPNWHYDPTNCEWVTRQENSRRRNANYWRSMTVGA